MHNLRLIRAKRREKRMTVTQLAVATHIHRYRLSEIERGKRGVTVVDLERILDVLGLELVIQPQPNSTEI